MTRLKSANLARNFEALFGSGTMAGLSDGQLLDRFITRRDEVAFEELIGRHGPVVLGICRRSLVDPHDVEDAFQATFLILVRKAASLRDRNALSSWLYGVSLRVVRRARVNAVRRRLRERPISAEPPDRGGPGLDRGADEALAIVDEEIRRLPEKQQVVVVLCLLEGYTHEAAASRLGLPLGTVKSRIAGARQTLIRRLTRRGLTPSAVFPILQAGLGLAVPSNSISPQLMRLVVETAGNSLANPSVLTATTSTPIARLVQEILKIMLVTRIQSAALLVLTLGTLGWVAPALLSARQAGLAAQHQAQTKATATEPARASAPPRTDRYGDPLPPGATMRLGTVRFRHDQFINHIAYSPDGRFVVTDDMNRMFQFWDANDGKKLRQIESGLKNTRYFAFSPDGKLIAAVGSQYDAKRDRLVHHLTLTDPAAGVQVRQSEWDEPGNVRRVLYAPDGKTLAIPNDSGSFQLWDAATLKVSHHESVGESHNLWLAFSPDAASHLLAIARGDTVRLWDTAEHRDVRKITVDGESQVTHPVFSPDGTILAAQVTHQGNIHEFWLWKVGDGTLLRRLASAANRTMYAMSFSPDGKVLAAIGDQDQLLSFDIATGQELDILSAVRATASPLVFSPDGTTLTTIAHDQVLHYWDRSTGKDRLATPDAHTASVGFLAFIDGGKTLVSGSRDQTLRFWDLATGQPLKVLAYDGWPESLSLSISANGVPLAASLAWPGPKVQVRNLRTGAVLQTWPFDDAENGSRCRAVTLSRGASTVTAASGDGFFFRSWDVTTGIERPVAHPKLATEGEDPNNDVDRFLFSPDGQSLALAREDGTLEVIDANSGNKRFRLSPPKQRVDPPPHDRPVEDVEFAPDGQSLAIVRRAPAEELSRDDSPARESALPRRTLVWLDIQTGHVRREISFPDFSVSPIAFSPDGEFVAACTSFRGDRTIIRIFRLRTRKEIQTIPTRSDGITALTFTPDSQQIVAGLLDTSIVLWNVNPTD